MFCLRFVPVRQVPRLAAYDSAVSSPLAVRPARAGDVAQMARVNVRCWQETYRGLMPDAVLDDPGFLAVRERFWAAVLTGERYRDNRVAVAERDGELIGIAMSGPPLDAGAAWARQLYVLYVYAADHGTGAGPALLEAVVDPQEPVALWVATRTLVHRRSTASTASLPTGRPRSRAGCGRSAWSAAGSTGGSPVRRQAPAWRRRLDGPQLGKQCSDGMKDAHRISNEAR